MRADYEIYIRGRLGAELTHALGDLRPAPTARSTRLQARAIDQPSLHGILARLGNLGIVIEAIWRTDVETIAYEMSSDPDGLGGEC